MKHLNNALATVPSRQYRRRRAYEYRQELMYLSMVSCIYISISAIGAFKMSVPFHGNFGLVGRLGSGLGLKPV